MAVPMVDLIQVTEQIASLNQSIRNNQHRITLLEDGRAARPDAHRSTRMSEAGFGGYGGGDPGDVHFNEKIAEIQGQMAQSQQSLPGLQNQLQTAMAEAGLADDVGIRSLVTKAGQGDTLAGQALQERLATMQRGEAEQARLGTLRAGFEKEAFGETPEGKALSLEEALAQAGPGGTGGGLLGTMGRGLASQAETQLSRVMRPEIREALGARGLADSGAVGALLGRQAVGLEQTRQSSLMQAGLGAKSQLMGLERADILGDIGLQRQALTGGFDLQRAGITMQFQRELAARQEALAKELASLGGGGGGFSLGGAFGGLAGGIGAGLLGTLAGGPIGLGTLATLGGLGFLSGGFSRGK